MNIKNLFKIVSVIVIFNACSDLEVDQTQVGFIGTKGVRYDSRINNDPVTTTLALTKILGSEGTVIINVSETEGLITDPAFDANGDIVMTFSEGEFEQSLTVDYENEDLEGTASIELTITEVSGSIDEIIGSNSIFTVTVSGAVQELPEVEGAISIAEARGMEGETVTIVGYVTTPDYGFSSGQYFVQDENAGINIFHSGSQGLVETGNIVAITGEVSEFSGQLQLSVSSLEILDEAQARPDPAIITDSDLTVDSELNGMLVTIEGVTLSSPSQWPEEAISSSSGVNVDASVDGTDFIIRIDRGESFYDGSTTPEGNITLTGVLSRFNDDVQILPFVEGDVVGDGSSGGGGGGNGGGGSGDAVTEIDEDFEGFADPGSGADFVATDWLNVAEVGTRIWRLRSFENNQYIEFTAFGSDEMNNTGWLILPQVDFDNLAVDEMTFSTQIGFGDANTELDLLYSTDFDGTEDNISSATWNELSFTIATEDNVWVESGTIDLSSISGEGYLAFRYIGDGTDENNDASYRIDDILVGTEGSGSGGGGGGGGGGGTSTFTLPFSDDFESCSTEGEFNIPSNWTEAFVAGSKTDRGWGCREFGRNGWGPRGSAFGGADGTDDAWMISDGKFDLRSFTSISLVFWVESRFSGPGDLEVKWSTDYSGSGDPSSATWTTLSDVAAQLPAEDSQVFTEITSDLSGAAGQEVYIAFRYFGGTASSSVALTLDDLSITGS